MPEEKKIIIDEDWKSQVQAEKEQLERQRQHHADPSESEPSPPPGPGAMPPASFEMLITSLATESMIALGQIPHPATQQVELDLDRAKYLIDTLGMLEQKTQGNLSEAEAAGLNQLLHQLRMAFLALERGAGQQTGPPADP